MPVFYSRWILYAQHISTAPTKDPATLKHCSYSEALGHSNCSSYYSIGPEGRNASLADLQAQWSAWRPVYTAKLRAALGTDKIIIANVPIPVMC